MEVLFQNTVIVVEVAHDNSLKLHFDETNDCELEMFHFSEEVSLLLDIMDENGIPCLVIRSFESHEKASYCKKRKITSDKVAEKHKL